MSLFSKAVSFAFLATTLVTDSLEKSMTKPKSKAARANSRTTRPQRAGGRQTSNAFDTEKTTAKRAVAEAGRATLAMAQYGVRRTAEAGRTVLARAARSAGHGIDDGLQAVAEKVMPAGRK